MGENLKKSWPLILINLCISLLVLFVGFKLTVVDTDARELNKKIEGKADLPYVMQQDNRLQEQIDKGVKEHQVIKDEMNLRLQRMEDKIDVTNEKILDLWKNMKKNN